MTAKEKVLQVWPDAFIGGTNLHVWSGMSASYELGDTWKAAAQHPSVRDAQKGEGFAGLSPEHHGFAGLPESQQPSNLPQQADYMQLLPGGLCFAHGRYEGMQCPHWPRCVTDPQIHKPQSGAEQVAPAAVPSGDTIGVMSERTENELLHECWALCPWCGADGDLHVQQSRKTWHSATQPQRMYCFNCGAKGPAAKTQIAAIDKWNAMAKVDPSESSTPDSGARLRAAIERLRVKEHGGTHDWNRGVNDALDDVLALPQWKALSAEPPQIDNRPTCGVCNTQHSDCYAALAAKLEAAETRVRELEGYFEKLSKFTGCYSPTRGLSCEQQQLRDLTIVRATCELALTPLPAPPQDGEK